MHWEISLCHPHGLAFYLDEPWLSVAPECNILHPPAFCTQPFRDRLPSHPEITLTTGGRWHLLNICTVAGCLWAWDMQHECKYPFGSSRSANCSWPLLQCSPAFGHWAGFPLECFLAARTQLHSLGDIPTYCHALPSGSLSHVWSAFAFFPFVLLLLVSCLLFTATQAYLTLSFFDCSNYLTVLLLCSVLVHFCQYVLHNEVLRNENNVLHVLTWELHTENSDSFPSPGNSTNTKKGLRKGSMAIKVSGFGNLWTQDGRAKTVVTAICF